MKSAKSFTLAALAAAVFCAAGWAKPLPLDPNSKSDKAKEKHWTGTLIDVGCMAKTLGAENMGYGPGPVFGVPRLLGWGAAIPVKTLDHAPEGNTLPVSQESYMPVGQQQPGQPGQQGSAPSGPQTGQPGQPGPEPMPGTMEQVPDPNAAAEARAAKVNDAARVCAASPSTPAVGLATGEGQVLQFDNAGNVKAREALKNADLDPGKKIKAKVTGKLQNRSTVLVASIELKGAVKPRA